MLPRISLGPILYYWPRAVVDAFYDAVCASPVDIVYVGEVICGKRHEVGFADWMAIARRLAAAGKEVVLSCLALTESETDLRVLRRIVGNGEFAIEANDMGAVGVAAQARAPFVIGPHVNAYNPAALRVLIAQGATRWVAPAELSHESLQATRRELGMPIDTEVFAYGRLPLAFSARCFTARFHDRPKDDCGFTCLDAADGIDVQTADGEPLFALNGVQTQSAQRYSLLPVLDDVVRLGIGVLRISPMSRGTLDVVVAMRDCLDGRLDATAAARRLDAAGASAGYWRGNAGIDVIGPR